jgi:hypothetical protein
MCSLAANKNLEAFELFLNLFGHLVSERENWNVFSWDAKINILTPLLLNRLPAALEFVGNTPHLVETFNSFTNTNSKIGFAKVI